MNASLILTSFKLSSISQVPLDNESLIVKLAPA